MVHRLLVEGESCFASERPQEAVRRLLLGPHEHRHSTAGRGALHAELSCPVSHPSTIHAGIRPHVLLADGTACARLHSSTLLDRTNASVACPQVCADHSPQDLSNCSATQ